MDVCSEKMIETYLLYSNPLYAFNFPISFLIGIFVFGYCIYNKVSDNSYINQILIPIAAILITMVLIDMISRLMISKKDKSNLMQKCKLYVSQPVVKNSEYLLKTIDLNKIKKYDGSIEGFQSNNDGSVQIAPKTEIDDYASEKPKVVFDNTVKNYKSNFNMKNPSNIKTTSGGVQDNDEYTGLNPAPLEYKDTKSQCIEPSNCLSLCSGSGQNPCNLITAVPGPQWLPQTAEAKQFEMKNNQWTKSICEIKN